MDPEGGNTSTEKPGLFSSQLQPGSSFPFGVLFMDG